MAPIEPVGWLVEERRPGRAVVGGAPDAAVIEADVEDVGLAGHAGERPRAAGPGRSDGAPVHLGIEPASRASGPAPVAPAPKQGTRNARRRIDKRGIEMVANLLDFTSVIRFALWAEAAGDGKGCGEGAASAPEGVFIRMLQTRCSTGALRRSNRSKGMQGPAGFIGTVGRFLFGGSLEPAH